MIHGQLKHWQPTTWLGGRACYEWHFKEIARHDRALNITIIGEKGRILDIIFDDPERKCPLEYVVWAFRYGTELGNLFIPPNLEEQKPDIMSGATFFRVENSSWIRSFDSNILPTVSSTPTSSISSLSRDEQFEVIANYELRFVGRCE